MNHLKIIVNNYTKDEILKRKLNEEVAKDLEKKLKESIRLARERKLKK